MICNLEGKGVIGGAFKDTWMVVLVEWMRGKQIEIRGVRGIVGWRDGDEMLSEQDGWGGKLMELCESENLIWMSQLGDDMEVMNKCQRIQTQPKK